MWTFLCMGPMIGLQGQRLKGTALVYQPLVPKQNRIQNHTSAVSRYEALTQQVPGSVA